MIQIEDDVYEKLKKDADDNKQIRHIIHVILAALIFTLFMVIWGSQLIDLDIQRRTAELQANTAITMAETNRRVMEIESEGMTKTEYFKWLEVRNKS